MGKCAVCKTTRPDIDEVCTRHGCLQRFVRMLQVQMHAAAIGKRIVAHGVVWHECSGCGIPWPFPKGSPPSQDEDGREWICAVCVNVLLAKERRRAREAAAGRIDYDDGLTIDQRAQKDAT